MEYVAGSIVTAVVMLFVIKFANNINLKSYFRKPRVSQSYSFSLLMPSISHLMTPFGLYLEPIERQSTNHERSLKVKMVIYNNKAYWIHDGNFYTAIVVNGVVVKESTKPVDTMGMDTVELKELSEVVEKLTEGTGNDSSNSGNQKF